MGGALVFRKTVRMALTLLTLVSIYAMLVFREVGLVTKLEAGKAHPVMLSVVEPGAVTWREVPLPSTTGRPLDLIYDAARKEFQLTFDSGEFLRVDAETGKTRRQRLPFIPGQDLPIVVQPQITPSHWISLDGRHAYFLNSQNELVTVDPDSLRVMRRQPALPEPSAAPHRFSSDHCFWHVAHDPSTNRLILVVRDLTNGKPLCVVQFEEPKRGFGTIQDFSVDGNSGTMRYAVDKVPGIRELTWAVGGGNTLDSALALLPAAPFPSGSQSVAHGWTLPIRRLTQMSYGEAARIDQLPDATAALRSEVPMVTLVPTKGNAWNYFPVFTAMPEGGAVSAGGPLVLVGRVGGDPESEMAELGLELVDLKGERVLRLQDPSRGSVLVPSKVANHPMLATSRDGLRVALTGPDADSIWVATVRLQGAVAFEPVTSSSKPTGGHTTEAVVRPQQAVSPGKSAPSSKRKGSKAPRKSRG